MVVQGTGPIGILALAAAREMGAGRVIAVGAPESPRLELARRFGADATVDIDEVAAPADRIAAVREIVGGYGADLVMDCSGHPSAGPEGIEFLRDGGTYVEMGQFTDAGSIETNWHRICTKDINVLGSWAFTANDLPKGVDMLWRARDRFPWYEHAEAVRVLRGGHRRGGGGRDGDAHGEVDHRSQPRSRRCMTDAPLRSRRACIVRICGLADAGQARRHCRCPERGSWAVQADAGPREDRTGDVT